MSKVQKPSFAKIALSLIGLLFVVILLLTGYFFGFIPSFSKKQTIQQDIGNRSSVSLINPVAPKTFTNPADTWLTHKLMEGNIKILSPLQIKTTFSVRVTKDAPPNTSIGIFLANKLEEKDINARRLSLYYYLKNEQWILKYQAGEISKYYGLSHMPRNAIQGTFSLLISYDGKTVIVESPKDKTRVFDLPDSLYDITNQMSLYALIGPRATLTLSSLSYQQSASD